MTGRTVAIILPSLAVGGAEKVAVELANGLALEGWTVRLLAMSATGPLVGMIDPRVELVDLGSASFRNLIPALARHFNERKPALILTTLYGVGLATMAARIVAKHKPRIIIGAHNSFRSKVSRPDNRKDKYLLAPLSRLLFPHADGFIAVSRGVGDELQAMLKLDHTKVRVIYNPVVSTQLLAQAREPLQHPWLGKPATRAFKTLLWTGRMIEQKGLDTLLESFALVVEARDCRLILVGDGPVRGSLEALAESLGIAERIDFVGFDNKPLRYMARADLFVLSSRWEGLGNVLIEAMACGCPVVSTDCDFGPAEILDGERYGLLAEVDNPQSLAEAIDRALEFDIPSRSDEASLKARSLDFTIGRAVEQYATVFKEVIE